MYIYNIYIHNKYRHVITYFIMGPLSAFKNAPKKSSRTCRSSETIRSELSDALKLLERLADKDGRTLCFEGKETCLVGDREDFAH